MLSSVKNRDRNIIDVASPLHLISKLLGYAIFSLERNDFSIIYHWIDYISIVWTILINFLLIYYCWFESVNHVKTVHKSDIMKGSLPIIIFCSYVLYVIVMIISFAMRKTIAKIFETIQIIDDNVRVEKFNNLHGNFKFYFENLFQFKCFNINFNYRRQKLIVVLITGAVTLGNILLVLQVIIALLINKMSVNYTWTYLTYFWCLEVNTIFILNFILLAWTVKHRFTTFNKCIKM